MLNKILLIQNNHDDDSEIQEALENEGYSTYITAGEFDGLKIAERYPADAIVCELDEFEKELNIVKRLNHNSVTEYIPLFLITSTGQLAHIRAAMDLGADDVLVKPINTESLLRSLNTRLRKIEILKEKLTDKIISTESVFSEKPKKTDHILVKIGKKLKIVEYSSIVCITALKEYSKFITEDGSKIVVRKSLKNWMSLLPAKCFLQIHRATIINIDYIEKIVKTNERTYTVNLINVQESFDISHRYANIIRHKFPT